MPPYRTILTDTADGICTITLNRPNQRNAQSTELLTELDQAILAAGAARRRHGRRTAPGFRTPSTP